MGKKYRGKDIFEELDAKDKNPIIPIVIFLCVVTILAVCTTIGIKLLEEYTDIDIPWTENKKTNKKKTPTSSRDLMDLELPRISEEDSSINVLDSTITLKKITKSNKGFLITFSLQTLKGEYTTIEAKQITIDGFYFKTTFAISDKLDYDIDGNVLPPEEQKASEVEVLIKKTELDAIDMFGFNELSIIYDAESTLNKEKDKELYFGFYNSLNIVNERKGLINIDTKSNVVVSYFKTVTSEDATYFYFDFKNENIDKDLKIYVKELMINNEIYDMSNFEEVSHRNSREAIYLVIPAKEVPRVNTMKVRFFLVEENENNEKSFFITNEYQKVY